MTPVIVTWWDALSGTHMEWEAEDCDPLETEQVRTIGFIRRETPQEIELVMSYGGQELAGRWVIPRSCIVSIRYLQTDDQSAGQAAS